MTSGTLTGEAALELYREAGEIIASAVADSIPVMAEVRDGERFLFGTEPGGNGEEVYSPTERLFIGATMFPKAIFRPVSASIRFVKAGGKLWELAPKVRELARRLPGERRIYSKVAMDSGRTAPISVGNTRFSVARTGVGDDIANSAVRSGLSNLGSIGDFGKATSSLNRSGKLPSNYITKSEAKSIGWKPGKGNLVDVAPGKMIGGDIFKNAEGKLPSGTVYREADLGYRGGKRNSQRLVYGENGKKYVTTDHYENFDEVIE